MRSDWFELKAHVKLALVLIGGAHSTVLMVSDGREKTWNGGERIVAVGFWSWGVGLWRKGRGT